MAGWIEKLSRVDRPRLGDQVPVLVFRAFRIFTEEYLEDLVGSKGTLTLLTNAGRLLGKEVGSLLKDASLEKYLEKVVEFVRENKIGLLVPEEVEKDHMLLRLDECITCSGLPVLGKRICHFEAGFVGGIVEAFTGRRVRVYETKCNAAGEGTCEVKVELNNHAAHNATGQKRS
ncbi:MAG: 4-vinyl reductase [Aquificae bacterium]|nr:4-vinyl reductase [Aquificota bacterium]